MAQVQVKNATGQVVLTISNIGASTLADDFSLLYFDMFGAPGYKDGHGPSPSGKVAWSHLTSGNDIFNGTSGNDNQWLPGTDSGNDVFNMRGGDDDVQGGVGNDTINGGAGYDRLSYQQTSYNEGMSAIRGATINVNKGTASDPWGFVDKFTGLESFEGSVFRDRFFGSTKERDDFAGGRGNDFIDGGDVSFVNGVRTEDRKDQVNYSSDFYQGANKGIVVDLETSLVKGSITGKIVDGFGNTDTVVDIERVRGTRFNDVFVGSRADNVFRGGEGKDSYNGSAGFDAIWFGDNFSNAAQHGVKVDLSRSSNQIIDDGYGNRETAISIEELAGAQFNDVLRGNGVANFLEGSDGRDTLSGMGGVDEFYWDLRGDIGDGDIITDFVATGPNKERLSFNIAGFDGMTSTVVLVNGTAAKAAVGTFVFNAASDKLYWDSDGTGSDAMVLVAVLNNVASLSTDNFGLY
ncbi:hypothetical protein [Cypionkella sp.]|uniref:hypothetical protein n=1 Tax=Cypionkella sp. TaxID=2811411 RepID=UPI00262604D5|nr:hypothetical protein [Cypionkella sp.]MDB5666293.1 hypothetical protein [Cypionkella sp.]